MLTKLITIFLLLLIFISVSSAQPSIDSSNSASRYVRPSIVLQFIGGSIAYAIPFWTLSGINYINGGDEKIGGVILGVIATGVTVPLVGNVVSHCNGSYWAGIGGALIGQLIAGPLYRYLGDHHNSVLAQYLALSIPPVMMSILLYQITLSDKDFETQASAKELFIAPSFSKSYGQLNLGVRF
jgi:hypothetical protein